MQYTVYDCITIWATLPVQLRFIRRGRASRGRATLDLDDDDRASDFEELNSDVEVDDLREWLETKPSGHTSQILPGQVMVKKYLPPGNVAELYEYYKSSQKLAGQHAVSYTTFNHVFKTRWSDVLAFRQRSMFTQCEICQLLKADLQNKQLSLEAKLSAMQMYRQHLHDQYADRTLCWRMQATSQDHESRLLTICIDGLDQAKFALPRDPQLRSSAVMRLGMEFGSRSLCRVLGSAGVLMSFASA